jgi:hypothetical protein
MKINKNVVLTANKTNDQLVINYDKLLVKDAIEIGYQAFQIAKSNIEKDLPKEKRVTLKKFMQTCINSLNDESEKV